MNISRKAKVIEPSLSRQLFNMAKKYNDVIDLTLGDPDILPPQRVRDAACEAIQNGQTRYSANAGLIELRRVIAQCFEKEYNISVEPEGELIATVGGMEALYLAISCLVNEGDEVIIHAPYYVNYVQMVRMCGGVPIIIYTDEENGFMFTREQLEAAVSDKTVAMIINSPCNPTGVVFGQKILDDIAEVAKKNDFVIISDEVYRTLVFEGEEHKSIINNPGMRERTVVIDSLSKRFAMTGYRIGYAVAPADLIKNMTKMQENIAACAPLSSQYAGIAAYSFCTDDDFVFKKFEERRAYMIGAISNISGLHCNAAVGTFYLFVNISSTGLDCLSFAYKLLEEQHVAVVPGITYGKEYDGYIRIAYTLEIEKLKIAIERIEKFMLQFGDEVQK